MGGNLPNYVIHYDKRSFTIKEKTFSQTLQSVDNLFHGQIIGHLALLFLLSSQSRSIKLVSSCYRDGVQLLFRKHGLCCSRLDRSIGIEVGVEATINCYRIGIKNKVINSVPYRPEYTVPASNPVHSTPLFRTGKNTGHTGLVPAVPANFGQYWPVPGVPAGTEKSFFFFFLSFVIFEFLLGQNGNLFALTYQYYLFSQYAMVTLSFLFFFSLLIDTKV